MLSYIVSIVFNNFLYRQVNYYSTYNAIIFLCINFNGLCICFLTKYARKDMYVLDLYFVSI